MLENPPQVEVPVVTQDNEQSNLKPGKSAASLASIDDDIEPIKRAYSPALPPKTRKRPPLPPKKGKPKLL